MMKTNAEVVGSNNVVVKTDALFDSAESLIESYFLSKVCQNFLDENPKLKSEIGEDVPLFIKKVLKENKSYDFAEYMAESLYQTWIDKSRFLVMHGNELVDTANRRKITSQSRSVAHFVRELYRDLKDKDSNRLPSSVYRELPAGFNVSVWIKKGLLKSKNLPTQYHKLCKIPLIINTVIEPPCIINSIASKRIGSITGSNGLILNKMVFDENQWYGIPIYVGKLVAIVYFYEDFFHLGVSTANLFEVVPVEKIEEKNFKPDLVTFMGVAPSLMKERTHFYNDKKNKILSGYVSTGQESDYFGYIKKTVLTLHNLRCIIEGRMPVHGAMASILLGDKIFNVIIVGDSGAGKSECLEALKKLGVKYETVFDDMGSISLKSGKLSATGTETGAFVRLDDLSSNMCLSTTDKAIFMNPYEGTNARLIMPVASYRYVVEEHPIHAIFYANNYTSVRPRQAIKIFEKLNQAIKVFSEGKRWAKKTTDEDGLVCTHWANPFGAKQWPRKHDKIAYNIFKEAFNQGIHVGEICTQLGIKDRETSGPEMVAERILTFLKGL